MKKTMLLFVVTAAFLAGCSFAPGGRSSIEGEWKLVSYGPVSAQISAVPEVETSIVFKDGQMSGNVGCNGFGGEYSIKGNEIEFGPVMSTMMYCEAVAEQESAVLGTLQERTSFVLDGNRLTITSGDGRWEVVLEKR